MADPRGIRTANVQDQAFARFANREGGGRSGGFRTIVLFRRCELAFFVYGFAKSGRANLRRDELEAFRLLADAYLALDEAGLAAAQSVGAIIEVKCNDQAIQV